MSENATYTVAIPSGVFERIVANSKPDADGRYPDRKNLEGKEWKNLLVNAIKEYEDISDFNINTTYSRYYPAGDKKYFLQVSGNSIYF